MRLIVIESKFRFVINSFFFLGDRMLIKIGYGFVNLLIVMFLWVESFNFFCFFFKVKKSELFKRVLKREIIKVIMDNVC